MELTKKHRIIKKNDRKRTMGKKESATISWREMFKEYSDEELPSVVLRGARFREGVTQAVLSETSGIPQGHISEMESGKRGIGVKTAKKLGQALKIGYKVFL